MTNILIKNHDLDTTIKSTLQLAMEMTHSEAGCLYITNFSMRKLTAVEVNGQISKNLVKAFSKANKILSKEQLHRIVEFNKKDKIFQQFQQLDEKLESFIIVPLIVGDDTIGYAVVMHRHDHCDHHSGSYSLQDLRNLKIYSRQAALLLDHIRMNIERGKKDFYLKTIASLVAAIDAKDIYTQNHSSRVAKVTVEFSKDLGLAEDLIESMHYGALLHDIGKIGVLDEILNKPGALTREEFAIIKEHPVKGINILAPMELEKDVLNIIRYHHERYDGMGYPEKLRGNEIPLTARIVSIVDAWDAMTSNRAYRKKLSSEEVTQELKKGKGSQFDPYLVEKFIALIDKFSYR
ncbi:metal dependent phosphohydrolase [Alkaliphilus metalliredigens QYMF]|uniref:Metal dependent phosphohydrolase n=1 Tax=Alkaliphilus metalliredigens (strain QYMF) TaxID=293826 RepID=A6TMF7_ALKMQ|nr:HD domain-containing phosphohydrolase [Alkaliphilus metalliredigens]ABR47375.1 metal dependent phosphohydrolase [Alkaliphilus metalliredigens QYMF]